MATAIIGLNNKGRKNVFPKLLKLTLGPTAIKPAPINAPTKPCVVDIGKPNLVAIKTVVPAANATDKTKFTECAISSGTNPLPEKFLINV